MLLAGDIGGTNTRLALFTDDAKEMVREQTFPSREHRSLASAIDLFFQGKQPRLRGATFGIAGPVLDGRVSATNLPWKLDERSLAKKLRLGKVMLLNDLVSLALGAIAAPRREVHRLLAPRRPAKHGNVVVIAAGTGLGEAALVWDGKRLVPCGTEGGHSDFAPRNDLEWELFQFIQKRIGGRVSYERIVSGPGFGTVYDFFREAKGVPEAAGADAQIREAKDRNAAIAKLGASGESEACARTLDLFAAVYGAEAGNLALKFLAVGGVFLAGGIAASLLPTLEAKLPPAFLDKGRFRPLLETVPVTVVKSSQIGLYGSARHAAGLT
jgi:glucokinase